MHTFYQKYTATLGFSRTTNNITQVIAPVEGQDRITVQTDKNINRYDYYGLSVNAPFEITKWWSSLNDLNVYYGHYLGNLANTNLANGDGDFGRDRNGLAANARHRLFPYHT